MASGKNKNPLRFSNCMILHKEKYWTWFLSSRKLLMEKLALFHSAIRRVHWLRYFLAQLWKRAAEWGRNHRWHASSKGSLKREIVLRIPVPPTHTPPYLWTVAETYVCRRAQRKPGKKLGTERTVSMFNPEGWTLVV